jgi:hypothetical protein
MRRHSDKRQLILVHERFRIPRRGGERIHVNLLERQLSAFLLRRIGGGEGGTEVIV